LGWIYLYRRKIENSKNFLRSKGCARVAFPFGEGRDGAETSNERMVESNSKCPK
jgi:hypothetical protein